MSGTFFVLNKSAGSWSHACVRLFVCQTNISNCHIRFIYCYSFKGKPVYVGSAFDPAGRDRDHRRYGELPIDRFIAKKNGDNFTLEIVEALRTDTRTAAFVATVPRENHWMDVLNTWHEKGGLNFMRASASFNSEEHYRAWRAVMKEHGKRLSQDPAFSAKIRAVLQQPKVKAKVAARINRGNHLKPEARAKHAAAARSMWANPEYRTKRRRGPKQKPWPPYLRGLA
jgi:hypothetical protein